MGFNVKTVWSFQTKKKTEKTFSLAKQPGGAHGPWKQQLNMALVNSKN